MSKSEARRMIAAHLLAASRARTTEKRQQHETAAAHYRKTFDVPAPISFGRSDSFHNNAAFQRAESQKLKEYISK